MYNYYCYNDICLTGKKTFNLFEIENTSVWNIYAHKIIKAAKIIKKFTLVNNIPEVFGRIN